MWTFNLRVDRWVLYVAVSHYHLPFVLHYVRAQIINHSHLRLVYKLTFNRRFQLLSLYRLLNDVFALFEKWVKTGRHLIDSIGFLSPKSESRVASRGGGNRWYPFHSSYHCILLFYRSPTLKFIHKGLEITPQAKPCEKS
jgi:hypothetical protein